MELRITSEELQMETDFGDGSDYSVDNSPSKNLMFQFVIRNYVLRMTNGSRLWGWQ
jgi:hypothetical protein